MSRERGRPKKDDARYKGMRIRLNEDELKKLQDLADYYHTSRSEYLRGFINNAIIPRKETDE